MIMLTPDGRYLTTKDLHAYAHERIKAREEAKKAKENENSDRS